MEKFNCIMCGQKFNHLGEAVKTVNLLECTTDYSCPECGGSIDIVGKENPKPPTLFPLTSDPK